MRDTQDSIQDVEEAEEPHIKGKVINYVLVLVAFAVLLIYLFIVGEADELSEAVQSIRWTWLTLALFMVVLYWVLESACMQIFANKMFPGFKFWKTNVVSVIGQYFNCITPLSSGGQPFQAYYYSRFGMPYAKSIPMLLCRFISYQLSTTTFCALVLILRFSYFTEQNPALMTLVIIGFIGGLGLMTMLLLLAFWRSGTTHGIHAVLRLGSRVHLVKNLEESLAFVDKQIEDAYSEVRFLLSEPKMLLKSSGVTFIQLLEYFTISYVIYRGFGYNSVDPVNLIACQAFVYMISSFVPTPGAMGAAEGSYALFFSTIYPNSTVVALSTFIWRLLTFYFPIVVGMLATVAVNHSKRLTRR
ncbi:lysylphosphatidylglycerol synthase transmembrane domain-containing protein [Curtanaerobium respiraculi]|uniref:lysylphosphatidylglycerol synthase transmembrane domain-containing protein n=1 Tax=Curtanaerobium respiraculi TaxID=2949669 RepID=UPI0024B3695B|nr:lysylphosphatidylglycerol synthase transmembrane domain-containing protein [Curtanaerobium respiraculi]